MKKFLLDSVAALGDLLKVWIALAVITALIVLFWRFGYVAAERDCQRRYQHEDVR